MEAFDDQLADHHQRLDERDRQIQQRDSYIEDIAEDHAERITNELKEDGILISEQTLSEKLKNLIISLI